MVQGTTTPSEDSAADLSGRVGFRDLYRAIGETEARLTALIQNALGPIGAQVLDHERRIRDIEAVGSREAREAMTAARTALAKAQAAEQLAEFFKSREKGIMDTLSFGQKLLLLIVALIGAVGWIIDLASRLGGFH